MVTDVKMYVPALIVAYVTHYHGAFISVFYIVESSYRTKTYKWQTVRLDYIVNRV